MAADPIQDQFEAFHRDNPQVYVKLVELVEAWLATGKTRLAIGALWERLRWEIGVQTITDTDFKLNNNYRSRYVRLLIQRHPEWPAGLFETRRLRSEIPA